MEGLARRMAYLQGLVDGVEIEDPKVGRLIDELVDVLADVVDALEEMQENQEELEEYVIVIDEDLNELEEEVYGEEDEEEIFDFDDFFDDCDCGCNDDTSYVEVECPECHEFVRFDSDILVDEDLIEVICPNCDAVVFVNDDSQGIFEDLFADDEEEDEED